ncbi:TetR family transcriptional regulator C-terminal domain-containing protein [Saxibacter everestensis]|uniref:TetR family transcriptional regulator C-terminal domain-containing protein n=1 Tax=Saxibacter everestensis TaxID=2909229 RepID=A0ABY8QTS2_9MICO|nr:TetR family transcriptional regulator C-terminal domain-containing protein [Brevibacteriaceae bacterium ZFBP1038]
MDAAREVAVDSGLVALTLKSVGAQADVASSLVAHYFPTMNDLVIETFKSLVEEELSTLQQLQSNEQSELERMKTLVGWLLGDARIEVTAVWLDALILGRRNNDLAAEVRSQLDNWQMAVSGSIRRGIESGEFECKNPDVVAAHILCLIDGLNAHSLVEYEDSPGLGNFLRQLVEIELLLPTGSLSTT